VLLAFRGACRLDRDGRASRPTLHRPPTDVAHWHPRNVDVAGSGTPPWRASGGEPCEPMIIRSDIISPARREPARSVRNVALRDITCRPHAEHVSMRRVTCRAVNSKVQQNGSANMRHLPVESRTLCRYRDFAKLFIRDRATSAELVCVPHRANGPHSRSSACLLRGILP
jgi:hypothetical protein